jgi:hypothetical protein
VPWANVQFNRPSAFRPLPSVLGVRTDCATDPNPVQWARN